MLREADMDGIRTLRVAERALGVLAVGLDAREATFWQGGLSVIERLIEELEAMEGKK